MRRPARRKISDLEVWAARSPALYSTSNLLGPQQVACNHRRRRGPQQRLEAGRKAADNRRSTAGRVPSNSPVSVLNEQGKRPVKKRPCLENSTDPACMANRPAARAAGTRGRTAVRVPPPHVCPKGPPIAADHAARRRRRRVRTAARPPQACELGAGSSPSPSGGRRPAVFATVALHAAGCQAHIHILLSCRPATWAS